ncbi:MAG: hypothetical protein WCS86_00145 [Candidatus Paceibacterota bacterium]
MLKKINKFSILAVIFTIFYLLVGEYSVSHLLGIYIPDEWVPKFIYKHLSVSQILSVPDFLDWVPFYIFYVMPIFISAIFGIIAIFKIDEEREIEKWIMILLVFINILMFVSNTIFIISPATLLPLLSLLK